MKLINNSNYILVINGENLITLKMGINDFTGASESVLKDIEYYTQNPNASGYTYIEKGELIVEKDEINYDKMNFTDFSKVIEVVMDKKELEEIASKVTIKPKLAVIDRQRKYLEATEKADLKNIKEI